MNSKRMGFKPTAVNNRHVRTFESFDPTFQFRPFKLYMITSEDDKYAISSEKDSDAVFLSKPDKNNKYQWVLIDSDTGAICFFYDLKNYMSIDMIDGIIKVKRNDILLNGLFNFKQDNTIIVKSYPKYCLAFRRIATPAPAAAAAPADANGAPKKEGFTSRVWNAFKEGFNAATEPVLEAVATDAVAKEPTVFSSKWKYTEIMDLRSLTDSADTISELQTVGTNNNKQITALQRMIENNKTLSDIEIQYRDDKISGYESNWFIKAFLK